MQTKELIAVSEFCIGHNIEISFINSLQLTGLIEITTIKEMSFVKADQLQQLEKIVRLHYDLDINLEGIQTITHLLQKMNSMQEEIIELRNRLSLYEDKMQITIVST